MIGGGHEETEPGPHHEKNCREHGVVEVDGKQREQLEAGGRYYGAGRGHEPGPPAYSLTSPPMGANKALATLFGIKYMPASNGVSL